MSDGDSSEHDQGGFVFGNDGAVDGEAASDGGGDGASETTELDTRRIAAALVLSLAIIVLAIVVQPLVAGVATDLFGADSPSGSGNATDATTAGEPSGSVDTTAGATGGDRTGGDTPTGATSAQSPTAGTSVITEATTTATATSTQTATQADENTTAGTNATASENATATPSGESPVIESFTVTDRSAGGNATLDVAWNVSDPNTDLVNVEVTIVADPDGEARTVASRQFDAGGASTVGDGTFGIEGGSGGVYEVRMEVTDGAGNSAFTLTREVADGDPDG